MSQSTLRKIFQYFKAFDLEEKTVRDFLSKSSEEVATRLTLFRQLADYPITLEENGNAIVLAESKNSISFTFLYDITQSPPRIGKLVEERVTRKIRWILIEIFTEKE